MHVLILPSEFFVPAFSPLAGIFQYDQACALRRRGVRVGVVAPELRPLRRLLHAADWSRRGFEASVVDGMPVFRWHGWHWSVPALRVGQATVWLRAGRALVRRYLEREGRPDVVHAHNARYAGMLARWVHREHGIPYLLTEHSSIYQLGQIPRHERSAIRGAFGGAATRFVVSDALGDAVRSTLGRDTPPLEVLPNLLDARFEAVQLPATTARAAGTPFTFLNVAELNANKRHIDLLQAFARVASRHPECRLRIAGGGPLRDTLVDEAARLGVADRVAFLGRLPREGVLAEMLACDAFVLTSRRETFGVVVAEALACGKPVVATASGGPNALVNDRNGFLVPAEDVASIANAIERMIADYSRFDAQVIRQDCMKRFGTDRIVNRLMNAYREAAA